MIEISKYTTQQLFNLLAITTKSIKIMRRNRQPKNAGFWQVVNSREALISEIELRKARGNER